MSSSDQTITALAAAGFGAVAPALAGLARNSIRLGSRAADEASQPLGASRLGGVPDLPPDVAWPQYNGLPMSFIAQIRLEEAAPSDTAHLLPPAGLLWFFYDARQQTYGDKPTDRAGRQVIYREAGLDALHRTQASAALAVEARFAACALTFTAEETLPQRPPLEQPGLPWTPADQARYDQFLAAYPTAQSRAAPYDRMLGYPDTLQDDMRAQCALAARGIATDGSDPRAAAGAPDAQEWLLLLQVDSDANAAMRWGDAGMLYFWVERAALAAQRFDNVWAVLQSE